MIYLDLAEKLIFQIKSGEIAPGTQLPTHRAFAEEHGIALATASRMYRILKQRGFIIGETGRGMFVRDPELPMTLGIEQVEKASQVDLVFNMPCDAEDGNILRYGLRWLAKKGNLNEVLKYQPHGGVLSERKVLASYLSDRLGIIDPEHLFITSGAQHGLSIATFGLLARGDIVAIDKLTYPGFLAAVGLCDLMLQSIPSSDDCMDPRALGEICEKGRIQAIYVIPTVHNPLGSVMGEALRRSIVEVARRHGLLIIEDGAYDFLETSPPPSFVQLAPERTVYVGGVSKILATGLRVGYIVAPPDLASSIRMAIRATTWNTPAVLTSLVTHWIADGTIHDFEVTRRNAGMKGQAICKEFLQGYAISAHPNASFAWLWLPNGKRAEPIVARLAELGIAVSSAEPYTVGHGTPNALRIAFGGIEEEVFRFGLEKVRTVIEGAENCGPVPN
ncbi:MAG: PLP-dependent aminotransferase family protein [Gammaproteobacteria bacterium]|nr:PLP-dependent aminotransferase family protein [Gammaproteobacteria bacterium]MCY4218277.1 PLP-dependent aminotransferase family protein [Gammaproteobacteria bacterium]